MTLRSNKQFMYFSSVYLCCGWISLISLQVFSGFCISAFLMKTLHLKTNLCLLDFSFAYLNAFGNLRIRFWISSEIQRILRSEEISQCGFCSKHSSSVALTNHRVLRQISSPFVESRVWSAHRLVGQFTVYMCDRPELDWFVISVRTSICVPFIVVYTPRLTVPPINWMYRRTQVYALLCIDERSVLTAACRQTQGICTVSCSLHATVRILRSSLPNRVYTNAPSMRNSLFSHASS